MANKAPVVIVKSNRLIEVRSKLTLNEQRIILSMISKIKPKDEAFKDYMFSISEFKKLAGLKTNSMYSEVRLITKSLIGKVFTIKESDGDLNISWLSSARYVDGSGVVCLRFDPALKPYLLLLQKEFTPYELKIVIKLKSTHSIRFYELLKQYAGIGERTIPVDELRLMLGIDPDQYKLFSNFKSRVILSAQKELKAKTDLSFEFTPVKEGRTIIALHFVISKNRRPTTKALPAKTARDLKKFKQEEAAQAAKDESRASAFEKLEVMGTETPDEYKKWQDIAITTLTAKGKVKPRELDIKFEMIRLLE